MSHTPSANLIVQIMSIPAVLDLAARFADGRLSTEKLLEADDEGLYEILTAVRGIGRVRF